VGKLVECHLQKAFAKKVICRKPKTPASRKTSL